jgi:hypothetical protein
MTFDCIEEYQDLLEVQRVNVDAGDRWYSVALATLR